MAAFHADDIVLNRFEAQTDVSIFQFDCSALKTRIKGVAQRTIKLLQEHLPRMLHARANDFVSRCERLYEKVQRNPANLDDFCAFLDHVNDLQQQLEPLSLENQCNMSILYLCQSAKINVADEVTRVCNEQN